MSLILLRRCIRSPPLEKNPVCNHCMGNVVSMLTKPSVHIRKGERKKELGGGGGGREGGRERGREKGVVCLLYVNVSIFVSLVGVFCFDTHNCVCGNQTNTAQH